MAAYVISLIRVTDPEGYPRYAKQVPATLEKYGGTVLVRGGESEVLEGNPNPRAVVVRFDSAQSARRWYDSEEYAGPKALRQSMADSDIILVEGA